jgi:hypothetical protein
MSRLQKFPCFKTFLELYIGRKVMGRQVCGPNNISRPWPEAGPAFRQYLILISF